MNHLKYFPKIEAKVTIYACFIFWKYATLESLLVHKLSLIEGHQRGQYLSGNPVRYNNNQNRGRDDFHQAPNPPPPQTPPPNNPKVEKVKAPLFKPVSEY